MKDPKCKKCGHPKSWHDHVLGMCWPTKKGIWCDCTQFMEIPPASPSASLPVSGGDTENGADSSKQQKG